MSTQPGSGRYVPDPYTGINLVLSTLMVLGTLLTVWYAFSVAGLLSAPPLIFPPPTAFKHPLQVMVYVITLVSVAEHAGLSIVLRSMRLQPGESDSSLALRRLVIRLTFAVSPWLFIAVLWMVVWQRQQSAY